MVIEQGKSHVLDTARTLRAAGRFPRGLNGGQQKRNEDANDGDHHEQFDKRKGSAFTLAHYPELAVGQLDEREGSSRAMPKRGDHLENLRLRIAICPC